MNYVKMILKSLEAGFSAVVSYLIVTSVGITDVKWVILLMAVLMVLISSILPW